ncbi:MAG: hypothetical protein ACRDZP_05090 [Acidimicrobiales bacterium]
MSETESAAAETVKLSFPASPEWLALARTTGAAIASRWAFTYDEIADLRLAIDELCLTLIEPGSVERLEMLYALAGDAITVTGTAHGTSPSPSPVNHKEATDPTGSILGAVDLSGRILDALVDSHGSEDGSGSRRAWLTKQRSVARA